MYSFVHVRRLYKQCCQNHFISGGPWRKAAYPPFYFYYKVPKLWWSFANLVIKSLGPNSVLKIKTNRYSLIHVIYMICCHSNLHHTMLSYKNVCQQNKTMYIIKLCTLVFIIYWSTVSALHVHVTYCTVKTGLLN